MVDKRKPKIKQVTIMQQTSTNITPKYKQDNSPLLHYHCVSTTLAAQIPSEMFWIWQIQNKVVFLQNETNYILLSIIYSNVYFTDK